MEEAPLWWDAIRGSVAVFVALAALSFVVPFTLAFFTVLRQRQRESLKRQQTSSILVGQVWHTRHLSRWHAFHYPLFLFGLDLSDEVEVDNGLFENQLWPLSTIMSFSEADHLKNGDGIIPGEDKDILSTTRHPPPLSQRICNLAFERTKGKFQPNTQTHRIYLITHLSYYGYCFNPVSFFYVVNRNNNSTEAVVAEVSNTPWNEMYPYVLHPQSVDQVQASRRDESTNYVFPKRFHVSPFMEMEYNYDWVFDDWSPQRTRVVTAMKGSPDNSKHSTRTVLQFIATMNVKAQGLNPFVLAWQLARYPVYCMIIQIWIHYEAFWLFLKGIAFQPHPEGAETTASRIIGDLMTPLFVIKDYLGDCASTQPQKVSTQPPKAKSS